MSMLAALRRNSIAVTALWALLAAWSGAARAGDPGADAPAETAKAHSQAWLSGAVRAQWQIVAEHPAAPGAWEVGREFSATEQVKLTAGLAEITFPSGTKMVVSAPAQFTITSTASVDLQDGKLSVRVRTTAKEKVLAIKTRADLIITTSSPPGDGGVRGADTEFSIELTPARSLDVQVFLGEVEIRATLEQRNQ